MARLLVFFSAAVFLLYGFVFVFFPHEALLFVVQESMSTGSAATDVRATYGGMSVGVGLVLYLLARNQETLKVGLLSVFALLLSMAVSRAVGMIVDGNPNNFMFIYLTMEIVAGVMALLLLKPGSTR